MASRFLPLLALLSIGCMLPWDPPTQDLGGGTTDAARPLSGRGYVHYHFYPDTGQCYCGVEYPFTDLGKMIAAASPSIHEVYGDLCSHPTYVVLTSQATGKSLRVRIVDKGGQPTDDFYREEQHIMDISEEAFDALDSAGAGKFSGRIYVDWKIERE